MPIKRNSLKRKQKGGSCGLLTSNRSLQPSKPVVDKTVSLPFSVLRQFPDYRNDHATVGGKKRLNKRSKKSSKKSSKKCSKKCSKKRSKKLRGGNLLPKTYKTG